MAVEGIAVKRLGRVQNLRLSERELNSIVMAATIPDRDRTTAKLTEIGMNAMARSLSRKGFLKKVTMRADLLSLRASIAEFGRPITPKH